MRKMTTGFYRPTKSFKSIPEHIAVMFEDDCGLVALVGASDDDPENLAETNRLAELFASAPEQAARIAALESDKAKLIEALKECANPQNWIAMNGEILWNDFEGNEHHTEHIADIARRVLAEVK